MQIPDTEADRLGKFIEEMRSEATHLFNKLPEDKALLGGILSDARYGWLALGPKLCIVDMRTGQKVAAWTFGAALSLNTCVACVCELPTPLTDNTRQLLVSVACEEVGGFLCVFHCNGSQMLRCIETKAVVTEMSVVERVEDGPLSCCDGLVVAGTEHGELIVFDINRAGLIQALKHTSQGYEHLVRSEHNMTNLAFLSLDDIGLAEEQREIALESDDHLAFHLNDQSYFDGEYVLRKPDGTVTMKAKRGHVTITKLLFVPQLGSVIVGYNFGAFQIWNLMRMCLEFTSPVNVECLPVTHFGFQEPCDDPRAFCYLWVTYSAKERIEDEASPLAVMYSLTYQGKRILSETQCLYQEFTGCMSRFELELAGGEDVGPAPVSGGRSIACHTYSLPSSLHAYGDEGVLNLCQLVWENWTDNPNAPSHYSMLLFDLDQWYKGQMPERCCLQNNTFMCVGSLSAAFDAGTSTPRDARLVADSLAPYTHVQRLEEHFYPNSLQYSCICLTAEDAWLLSTAGVQRQLISSMDQVGPTVLLHPAHLYRQCVLAGLTPLYDTYLPSPNLMEQRKFLLSVALEGRLTPLLKKCARDWASGSHSSAGCTLQLFVEWCWSRALVLKKNARDLTAPMLKHSVVADRNVFRCLEHCVRQLTLLASLLDSVVTKCCNLIVPDALSDMEERCKVIGMVATYFRVVQWFLDVGLLPECSVDQEPHMLHNGDERLPYPVQALTTLYQKRRMKLCCLDGKPPEDKVANRSCALLYIDQLMERECGGELVRDMWRGEGAGAGLYPPPSLHALLRVYLLSQIQDQHKHALVLYLLLDFSATFNDARYEAVIRRLMQFPTMFGLSNTAIKATQAFWHLDHRNFDFALDQLQCLTGNTLSDWQHSVVLSALLAQKKTQAALQYLHVRKPPPVQPALNKTQSPDGAMRRKDHDKLEDWQSCCDLYLARQLVFEAMDMVRACAQNAGSFAEKAEMLDFFFRGCKRTGQLSKILQITLLPFEEEMFIKYLEASTDKQCADILVMYYLQQARYLEAQRYNNIIKQSTTRSKQSIYDSADSLFEVGFDSDLIRDTLVNLVCTSLPRITDKVEASINTTSMDVTPKVVNAKPMSVFVQAKSPKNTFVYRSSFIQSSIETASETWVRRPQLRHGMKRALQVEDTPFLCSPKLSRASSSMFGQSADVSYTDSPSKRQRLDTAGTPRTPVVPSSASKTSTRLSRDVLAMLDIPEVEKVAEWKIDSADDMERSTREATPQSILKVRHLSERRQSSPLDSHYLADTDEELETASRHSGHTHTSDKHLRFAIPSSSSSATPSPETQSSPTVDQLEVDIPTATILGDQPDGHMGETTSHSLSSGMIRPQSPLTKSAESSSQKKYKDNVRARLSHSISANSSLNEDPHSSVESIADIPVMIINPRYSGEGYKPQRTKQVDTHITINDTTVQSVSDEERDDSARLPWTDFTSTPRTPRSRPSIKSRSGIVDSPASTRVLRSLSRTPERAVESPSLSAVPSPRPVRSRSRTPDHKGRSPKGSPSLESIPEVPKLEQAVVEETSMTLKMLKTPEKVETETRIDETMGASKMTEAEVQSEPAATAAGSSPMRRSLRSRSRTPEIELPKESSSPSIRTRGRSKTPEREIKLISPRGIEKSAKKKPLSRLVLEANIFTKITKSKAAKTDEASPAISDTSRKESSALKNVSVPHDPSDSIIKCTPMKGNATRTMPDYEFSPIVDSSVLSGSVSILSNTPESANALTNDMTTSKTGTPLSGTFFDKSVLGGYKSSSDQSASNSPTVMDVNKPEIKHLTTSKTGTPFSETFFDKSVLGGYKSSSDQSASNSPTEMNVNKPEIKLHMTTSKTGTPFSETFFDRSVLGGYNTSSDHSASNSPTEMDVNKPEVKPHQYSDSPIDPLSSDSVLKDNSTGRSIDNSALTDDLDEPMSYTEENDNEVENKAETKETSNQEIQEEKQKIVEIEREINEIEGQIEATSDDGSDNSGQDSDNNSDELDSGQDLGDSDTEENNDERVDSDSEVQTGSEVSNAETEEDNAKEKSDSEYKTDGRVKNFERGNQRGNNEDVYSNTDSESVSEESDNEETEEDTDHSSHGESKKALCGDSEVILLNDSSDEEKPPSPKKQRLSASEDSGDSVPLQIDIGSDDEIEMKEESNSNTDLGGNTELERNIDSNMDTSFSESVKDGSGMMDKDQDPFLEAPSDKGNQSEGVLKPEATMIVPQDESISALDAFNDGNYSLMTDDNSVLDTDRSEIDTTAEPIIEQTEPVQENKTDETKQTNLGKEIVTIESKQTENAVEVVVDIETMDVVVNVEEAQTAPEEKGAAKTDHELTSDIEHKNYQETDNIVTSTTEPMEINATKSTRKRTSSNSSTGSRKSDKSEVKINESMFDPEKVKQIPNRISTRRISTEAMLEVENPPTEATEVTPRISRSQGSAKSDKSDDISPKRPATPESKDTLEAENAPTEVKEVTVPSISAHSASLKSNEVSSKPTIPKSKENVEVENVPTEAKEVTTQSISTRRASAKSIKSDEISPIRPKTPKSKYNLQSENPPTETKGVTTPKISTRRASAKSNKSDEITLKTPIRSKSTENLKAEISPKMPTIPKSKENLDAETVLAEAKEVTTPRISTRRALAKTNKSDDISPKRSTPESKDYLEAENPPTEAKEVTMPRISTRRASVKSNKSDEITPKTPTRSKSKENLKADSLPKEAKEVTIPRISTRRASAKSNQSDEITPPKMPTRQQSKEEVVPVIPLRRSTRHSSKQSEDDDTSVKSDSSAHSKASKDGDSVKSSKKRKSFLTITKSELSVIPEVEDIDSLRLDDASQMVQEYSSSRRLTRHQRSLLEKSMEAPKKTVVRKIGRPSATSSVASIAGSDASLDEESSRSEAFSVQSIDPISLLNKKDFEGPPDADELNLAYEEFQDSPDINRPRKLRVIRSASETGSIKELRQTRRLSMDLDSVSSPVGALDSSMSGSPGRARRTSFSKALEAIATPKRSRRASTDVKEGETDSVPGSPQPSTSKDAEVNVTPSRRTRRTSIQSDTPTRSPARRTLRRSSIAESTEEASETKVTKKN